MNIVLFLFVFIFCNINFSYASTRHLGELFRDIVFPSKRISYEYLQMHTKLHSDHRLRDLGNGYKLSSISSSYTQFDDELFERINRSTNAKKHSLKVGKKNPPPLLVSELRHSFANGHKVLLDAKTETRKILVSLYPGNTVRDLASQNGHFSLQWFSPIIEFMLCPTLSSARKKLAILNLWHAYSGIAVVAIDKDQEWVCSYGLVAPKIAFDTQFNLPNHVFPRLIEPQDRRTLENSAIQLNKARSDFYEYLPGSGTQYYIPYIDPTTQSHSISDLGSMLDEHGKPLPEYQLKNKAPRGWGYYPQQPCHLLDAQHNLAEINIHKLLWKEGYLYDHEF